MTVTFSFLTYGQTWNTALRLSGAPCTFPCNNFAVGSRTSTDTGRRRSFAFAVQGTGVSLQHTYYESADSTQAISREVCHNGPSPRSKTSELHGEGTNNAGGIPMSYGFSRTVPLTYERAIERVTEELKKEGFGVLTTIDVKETLKKKLDVDFHKYVILGACNPPFAHQTLQADDQMGLLLPCNVIVYEEGAGTFVNILDPLSMTNFIQDPALDPMTEEAHQRLQRVAEAIQS